MIKREYDWIITDIEGGDTTNNHYGLAVDLGSTTIIMQLVDLNSGEVIVEESIFNKQIKYGEDILTRIFYTKEYKDGLEAICKSTVESFADLLNEIKEKTNINVYDSSIMVVSGNTTMTHFLLGVDPWTIFQSPFTPIFNESGFIKGNEIGIPINGYVYCFPSVANYFGGAFGTHLNLESAVTIGMYPDLKYDKIICPGNTSLKGSYTLLTNRGLLKEIEEIKNKVQYLQLSNATDFVGKMRAASFIPHTNLELYPRIKKNL